MAKFYVDFEANITVNADTKEEAKEVFWSKLPSEIYATIVEIEREETEEENKEYCEWTYNRDLRFAKSGCGSLDTHRIDFLSIKYCPYCGKKIKIK